MSTDNVINLRWRPTIKFSTRLREHRLDYGKLIGRRINQDQMAELLNVPPGTYKGWESGNSRPSDLIETAHQIHRVTGADPAWLLDVADEGPMGPNQAPGLHVSPSTWIDTDAGQPFGGDYTPLELVASAA